MRLSWTPGGLPFVLAGHHPWHPARSPSGPDLLGPLTGDRFVRVDQGLLIASPSMMPGHGWGRLLSTPPDGEPIPSTEPPESGESPPRLLELLQIDPNAYKGKPLILTPDEEAVLRYGGFATADLARIDSLFKALEPDDGGLLAEAAADIPHEVVVGPIDSPAVGLMGMTDLPLMEGAEVEGIDPRIGRGRRMLFMVWPHTKGQGMFTDGFSALTVKHERIHAVGYDQLPSIYRVDYRDIPPHEAPLLEIFRAIYFNRIQREVPAFVGPIRTAEIFRLRRGENLWGFPAQKILAKSQARIRAALLTRGWGGVHEMIADSNGYLSYKVAALIYSLLWKMRVLELPPWKELIEQITRQDLPGQIDAAKLKKFFDEKIDPLVKQHGLNLLLRVAGQAGTRKGALLVELIALLTGMMGTERSGKFLRIRFEDAVQAFGELLGDPSLSPAGGVETANSLLPPLASPRFGGKPLRPPPSKETAADEIEIAGNFVEILHNLDQNSDDYPSEHLGSFLRYAERTDPEGAGHVYGRLLELVSRGKISTRGRWELGLSLFRYGYEEEGRRILKEAIDRLDEKDLSVRHFWHKVSPAFDLTGALEQGLFEEALLFLEKAKVVLHESRGDEGEESSPPWNIYSRLLEHLLAGLQKEGVTAPSEILDWVRREVAQCYEEALREEMKGVEELRKGSTLPAEAFVEELQKLPRSFFQHRMGPPDHFESGDPAQMVAHTLQTPGLFETGLKMLQEFPPSLKKLRLYREAARHFPAALPDERRKKLAVEYETLLAKALPALKAWDYSELPGRKEWPGGQKAPDPELEETHLYLIHRTEISLLLLGSEKANLKEEGRQYLRNLSSSPRVVRNTFLVWNESSPRLLMGNQGLFLPAVWRVHTLLGHLGQFPPEERGALLGECLQIVSTLEIPEPYFECEFGRSWLPIQIAAAAAREGNEEVFQGVVDYWDRIARRKIAGTRDPAMEMMGLNEEDVMEGGMGSLRERELNQARFLLSFYGAVLRRGEGLVELLGKIREDRALRYYDAEVLSLGLRYLGDTTVARRLQGSEEEIFQLAVEAINRYVAGPVNLVMSPLDSFTKVLAGLPLSNEKIDLLFCHFIERATPEGNLLSTPEWVPLAGEGISTVTILFGNEKMPRSEALLLNRLARAARSLKFAVGDQRSLGLLFALSYAYTRLPGLLLVSPEERAAYREARDGEQYRTSLDALERYRSRRDEPQPRESSELREAFLQAKGRRDPATLKDIAGEIRRAIAQEVKSSLARVGTLPPIRLGIRGYDSLKALPLQHLGPDEYPQEGLLRTVFDAWEEAALQGDAAWSDLLLPLWAEVDGESQKAGRTGFYLRVTGDNRIPIAVRRRVFEEYSKSGAVSSFVQDLWERLIEDGDEEREQFLYRLAQPLVADATGFTGSVASVMIVPSDLLLAVLANEEPAAIDQLLKSVHKYAAVAAEQLKGHHEGNLPLPEPGNPFELWFYADLISGMSHRLQAAEEIERALHEANPGKRTSWSMDEAENWYVKISWLFDALISALRHPEPAVQLARDGKHLFEQILKFARPFFPSYPRWQEWDLPDLAGGLAFYQQGVFAQRKVTRESLALFEQTVRIRRRAEDRLMVERMTPPPHLEDRSPQAQVIATRLYLSLPAGLQQTLSIQMKSASRAEATRLLLETAGQLKAAQGLSYWPGVPAEEQGELLSLQAHGTPSERDEVVLQIRQQLGYSEEAEVLVRNLGEQPIGVGTVADTYRSSLADGTPVAVKVITPTKERRFRSQIEGLDALRRNLLAYEGLIEHIGEIVEAIETCISLFRDELDLRREAERARRFESLASSPGVVPHYFHEFDQPKLAVIRYLEGSEFDRGSEEHRRLAAAVLPAFLLQSLHQLGLAHIDLQPGNLRVLEHELGILDFGQVSELTSEESAEVVRFLAAIGASEPRAIRMALERMGKKTRAFQPEEFERSLGEFVRGGNTPVLSKTFSSLIRLCRAHGLILKLTYRKLAKGLAAMDASTKPPEPSGREEKPGHLFCEAERARLATALRAGDEPMARAIVKELFRRACEHKYAIGWRNTRRFLSEFFHDALKRSGPESQPVLERLAAEAARDSRIVVNVARLVTGDYLHD